MFHVVGFLTAQSAQAQAQEQAQLAAKALSSRWQVRWQVSCIVAISLGAAALLFFASHARAGSRHDDEDIWRAQAEAARRAAAEAWERERPAREAARRAAAEAWERERPAREAAQQAQRAAEEAARRAAAEAWERERPAREAAQKAQRAAEEAARRAAAEAWERERAAREAAQLAAAKALEHERRAREQKAKAFDRWRGLQRPIGEACASSSPIDPKDTRRQQGFFACPECSTQWRSNNCWKGVLQICPRRGCHCAVKPFRQSALDREDDNRVQLGFLYSGMDRSFGRYHCDSCKRPWQSAHAWRNETQTCLRCHSSIPPFWQEELDRSAGPGKVATDRPHDSQGCSKCQKVSPRKCYHLPAAGAPGAGRAVQGQQHSY